MPTLHFEYTANLKIAEKTPQFIREVHQLLVKRIKTDLETCRSLVIPYSDFIIGSGDSSAAFIQLTLKILPGRTNEVKNSLGSALYQKIRQDFGSEVNRFRTQVRVYLQDTDIDHYYGLKEEKIKSSNSCKLPIFPNT